MTDSFAEHPISIAEARSSKTDLARDWSPRDVLVALLREIDKGDLDIDAVVVFMRPRAKGGGFPVVVQFENWPPKAASFERLTCGYPAPNVSSLIPNHLS